MRQSNQRKNNIQANLLQQSQATIESAGCHCCARSASVGNSFSHSRTFVQSTDNRKLPHQHSRLFFSFKHISRFAVTCKEKGNWMAGSAFLPFLATWHVIRHIWRVEKNVRISAKLMRSRPCEECLFINCHGLSYNQILGMSKNIPKNSAIW